jgi:hypothetical protein
MRSNAIWALPVAIVMFGCARAERGPREPTTATPAPAPSAIGGGPRDPDLVPGEGRPDPARADRMVESRKDEFRSACYSTDRGIVSLIIDVTITPEGRVQRAAIASVDGDPKVAECVRARIEQMTFPETAEGGVHTFTFLFAD